MTTRAGAPGKLWAISDLHVGYEENRALVERTRPESDDDWLLVAGDVAETVADIRWALGILADRFRRVVWAPATTNCGHIPRTRSTCAASPATSTSSRCAGNWA